MPPKNLLNSVVSKDTALNTIKKYFDAHIDFNKSIIDRLHKGQRTEVLEIIISMYIDLSEVPKLLDKPSTMDLEIYKRVFASGITATIERDEKLRALADTGEVNVDYLYLNLQLSYELRSQSAQLLTRKQFERIFSHFYEGKELSKKVKDAELKMNSKDINMPVMADIQALKDLLGMLVPYVSPECLRFQNDAQIYQEKKGMANIKVVHHEGEKKKALKLYIKDPTNKTLNALLQEHTEVAKSINRFENPADLHIAYTSLFEKMKKKYRIVDELAKLAEEGTMPQELKSQTEANLTPSLIINEVEISQNVQTTKREESSLEPSVVQKETSIQSMSSLPVAIETLSQTSLKHEVEEEFENVEVVKEQAESNNNNYSSGLIFFKHKQPTQESKLKPLYNALNLNKEHKNTLLEVFGKQKYDSITLRSLINLCLAFGATLTPTGRNRCRIEINNIFAHILVPKEALEKACNTATVTIHGGGHRKNSSQNHDRAEAPPYLIEQFKRAFVRAGYTLINLGLEKNEPELSTFKPG